MNQFRSSLAVILLSIISFGAVFAQETDPLQVKKWGLEQRLVERQKYEDSWRYSGPDSNIDAARKRGLQQFLSVKRKYTSQQIQSTSAWEQVGGSQDGAVSGRPAGIAFDPRNRNHIYLATSGGGLWKTTDGGQTWFSLSDTWSSYATGDVEVDPKNPDIVYAGTGDLHDQPGDGIYKSFDGGLNWTHITDPLVVGRTSQIIIDPINTNIIYFLSSTRIVKSTDAGQTWVSKLTVGGVPHMVIDPINPTNLVVGGGGEIVRSTDGGETWTGDLAANIGSKGRITMALSKTDPSKLYASVGGTNGASRGLARSVDSGKTWVLSAPNTEYMGQQSWYDNACAVSPTTAKIAVVGGLDVWSTNDSGKTLVKKSEWTRSSSSNDYCHADIHVLEYSPVSKELYALTDGGVFVSPNNSNGAVWKQSYNSKLSTLLFVGADAAPDFSYVIGGTQDNGINRALEGAETFKYVKGGDGGRTFVSQTGPQTVYSTYIGAHLRISPTAGTSWIPGVNGSTQENMIPITSSLLTEGAPFYMYYDVCETDGSAIALCGNQRLYYSFDGCATLDTISKSGAFSGGLRTVHIAKGDATTLYVGAGGGNTYTTRTASSPWTKSTTKIGTASGFATDINDACKVYAVTSGFGGKHFFRSIDCGLTWESPDVNLPDLDTRTIARAPNGDLFIGHTYGVMRSIDNGVTWESLRDGLPLCDVRKLQVRGTNNEYLLAATYGRGLYRINIAALPRTIANTSTASEAKFAKLKVTSLTPNPLTSGGMLTLAYDVKDGGELRAEIYDETGKQLRTFGVVYASSGSGKIESSITGLSSGAYFMVVTANGEAVTQKFIINQ